MRALLEKPAKRCRHLLIRVVRVIDHWRRPVADTLPTLLSACAICTPLVMRSRSSRRGTRLALPGRQPGRTPTEPGRRRAMPRATLTITSKNYSSWSLRGWLLARFAGLTFEEKIIPPDDPAAREEILLLSSSIRVPCLCCDDVEVWDTLAIGEFLNELKPQANLLPDARAARAHCRAICGEMHSGFSALRSSLPMNLKGHFTDFKIWSRA